MKEACEWKATGHIWILLQIFNVDPIALMLRRHWLLECDSSAVKIKPNYHRQPAQGTRKRGKETSRFWLSDEVLLYPMS